MDNISSSQESVEEISKDVPLFENPFAIEDLMVFDDATMRHLFGRGGLGLRLEDVAWSLQGASKALLKRVSYGLPARQRANFMMAFRQPVSRDTVNAAQKRVLDTLFWELTYWKTPELYEELTEGECLHPGIFQQLEPDLCGKTVLDVGAGSGRATFECVRYGARLVYAVEPSPGLLRILKQKLASQPDSSRIIAYRGYFDQIPLDNHSVDISLSCSAFTAEPERGGEPGLIELQRVTKPGGKIVFIWPRREDYGWLVEHGFQYVSLPLSHEMKVRFRSLPSALRCARLFYAHNRAVVRYILKKRQPEVPFSVLGSNPPCDYCWLTVK